MSLIHTGNIQNEIMMEEHDGILNAKKTSLVSAPTIFAVVNTSAAGQSSVVLDAGTEWIGLATVTIGAGSSAGTEYNVNDVVPSDPAGGTLVGERDDALTTLGEAEGDWTNVRMSAEGALWTQDYNSDDMLTSLQLIDNIVSGNEAQVDIVENTAWSDPGTYIGLVSTASIHGNVGLVGSIPAGTNNIGDVDVLSNTAWSDPGTYIGLATVINATPRTFEHLNFAANTSGAATIFVPTNTFHVTHVILSANATVGVNFKSGPTYLTGNASISMTLFPGGGLVENGQENNPVYQGLADGGSFVIETDDVVDIAGKIVYYEE